MDQQDGPRAAAVARITDKRDFRTHAVVQCAVNTLLVVISEADIIEEMHRGQSPPDRKRPDWIMVRVNEPRLITGGQSAPRTPPAVSRSGRPR
jgi:hypothetical protein